MDTGSGSSYASETLIQALNKEPLDVRTKNIEMMLGSRMTKAEEYSVNIRSVKGDFNIDCTVSKVEKPQLVTIDNPNYSDLKAKYSHLEGVHMDDDDTKSSLPVHLVLGDSDYARIKTKTAPRIGFPGQPVAEKTAFGCTIISPGSNDVSTKLMFTRSTVSDYDKLCRLYVLGLADTPEGDQEVVHQEFREQLVRHEEGFYEAALPWIGNHPDLPSNKSGSLKRLDNLVKKLERTGNYEKYQEIIENQKEEGIVETAPVAPSGQEFYIPHKAVVRESAESTKIRIVYDASASESSQHPSLNDCLHPGPPLQNLLWSVLVRARFYPVLLSGDLQKAFLQVRIRAEKRDALRFHWKPKEHSEIETFRFTRALFGLTCLPFLLGGVLEQHLDTWEAREPELVKLIRKSLYVDDLIGGSATVQEGHELKQGAIQIFKDATFTLHKWNSNAPELEQSGQSSTSEEPSEVSDSSSDESTFAKQQLGTKSAETKLLGTPWNKLSDTLNIPFPTDTNQDRSASSNTKREVLSQLAEVYDPLGIVSPMTICGKFIFRDI